MRIAGVGHGESADDAQRKHADRPMPIPNRIDLGRYLRSRRLVVNRAARPTVVPRWGWSGAGILQGDVQITSTLQSIVAEMGHIKSTAQQLLQQDLLALRPRDHRYLRQDEFGPCRAEQIVALCELQDWVRKSDRRIDEMPHGIRLQVDTELAKIELIPASSWFDDKEISACCLAAS